MVQTKEERNARQKKYESRAETKAKRKAYLEKPEVKERRRAYEKLPHVVEMRKKYRESTKSKAKRKAYNEKPEVKERRRELSKTPEKKAKKKAYREKPEVKDRTKKYLKKWRSENKEYNKKYRSENKEYLKELKGKWEKKNPTYYRQQYDERRLRVLTHYSAMDSPTCGLCGEKNSDFLHVDHKVKENKKFDGRRGANLITYLLKNNFPKGYQILCGNCNWLKEFGIKKDSYSKNPDAIRARKRYVRLKFDVLSYYSKGKPKCICCGFDNIDALSVDHIEGRKKIKHPKNLWGPQLYSWIIRNEYPDEFQILCIMCNTAKSYFSKCPHQK